MNSSPQSAWNDTTIAELTRDNLSSLFDSRVAAIRIKDFASPAECEALITAIDQDDFAYSPLQSPPIGRIGVTQYSHHDQAVESYFHSVPAAQQAVQEIFSRSFDPVARMINYLQSVWPAAVDIASCKYGNYQAGLIRLIHEYAGLHFDFVPIEGKGWSIDDISAQISWNLPVSTPDEGGACVVYDRRCEFEHGVDQLLADQTLITGSPKCTLDSKVGDVVLFNTRNYHEILPCSGGRRITISSFIGKKPDGSLALWS